MLNLVDLVQGGNILSSNLIPFFVSVCRRRMRSYQYIVNIVLGEFVTVVVDAKFEVGVSLIFGVCF
jgi:hypothetical protein